MKKQKMGGILILLLLGIGIFSLVLKFFASWSSSARQAVRNQIISESAALSSARVWADGLKSMGDRWMEAASFLTAVDLSGFHVASSHLIDFEAKVKGLNAALSGYSSRTKAVMTVVIDANESSAQPWVKEITADGKLGLDIEPAAVFTEGNLAGQLNQAWIKRNMQTPRDPIAGASVSGQGHYFSALRDSKTQKWQWQARQKAGVVWDPQNDQSRQPGGFPSSFNEGVNSGAFDSPSPVLYRAVLGEGNGK